MSAVLSPFDIRPITDHAAAALLAQKDIERCRNGEDPEIFWDGFLRVVDQHGLHSVAAAAYIREIGKRIR